MNKDSSLSTGSTEAAAFTKSMLQAGLQTPSNLLVPTRVEDIQSSYDSEFGLPFVVESDDGKEEYEVRQFICNAANLDLLWWTLEQYGVSLIDGEMYDQAQFNALLMSRNTVVLELGDIGMLFAFDVKPGRSALVKFLFLDRQTHNRQKVVLMGFKWLMEQFDLQRISITVPSYMRAALKRIYEMGLMFEGRIRSAYEYKGSWTSLFLFGVLRSELSPAALERGKLFRKSAEEKWFQYKDPRPRV